MYYNKKHQKALVAVGWTGISSAVVCSAGVKEGRG